jgi:pyoverdine/dityrosine biosynthesis protein Dit1
MQKKKMNTSNNMNITKFWSYTKRKKRELQIAFNMKKENNIITQWVNNTISGSIRLDPLFVPEKLAKD